MMESLVMGAYGAYVWGCFGLTVLVVGMLEWRARSRHRRVYRDIEIRIRALGDKE